MEGESLAGSSCRELGPRTQAFGRGTHWRCSLYNVLPLKGCSSQYLAAFILNLASFAYGTVMGWSAPSQPALESPDSPLGEPLSSEEMSWLASTMCLGGMVGSLVCGAVADRWGRKTAGLVVAIPFIVSSSLILAATKFPQLLAARLLAGFSCGGVLSVVPMYVGEVAEPALRGTLGAFLVLFINTGILFVYAVGAGISFMYLNLACLTVPVVFALLFWLLPETPSYLVSQGKISEASRAMLWLRGKDETAACEEMSQLTSTCNTGAAAPSCLEAIRELISARGSRRAFVITLTVFTVQQFSGIFPILNFTVDIFAESGSELSPYMCSIVVAVLQLVGSCAACVLVDRVGRKVLLLVSLTLMSLCLAVIGTAFYVKDIGMNVSSFGWVPVVAMSVYIVSFALGIGPVPYVLVAEMFPARVRSTASSLDMLWVFFLAFILTKFFNSFSLLVGIYGSFWLFAAFCAFGVVFTSVMVPETKGRIIADILKDLEGVK